MTEFTPIVIATDRPNERVTLDALPPAQYTIGKRVTWKDARTRGVQLAVPQWDGGSRSFSLSVLYDTYEQTGADRDVRKQTRQLTRLAEPVKGDSATQRPPVCTVTWGADVPADAPYTGLPFSGVVESVTQKFTMFDHDGTPVRAAVDITFREVKAPERQLKERGGGVRNSPLPARSHVVRRGDSLWSIAALQLGDPGTWREVARANGIVDPHKLEPGTVLLVPSAE